MGLGFIDTVTSLELSETTDGLELLAEGTGLEHLPLVTGLKLFPKGLETLLADNLAMDICVGLLTSV